MEEKKIHPVIDYQDLNEYSDAFMAEADNCVKIQETEMTRHDKNIHPELHKSLPADTSTYTKKKISLWSYT